MAADDETNPRVYLFKDDYDMVHFYFSYIFHFFLLWLGPLASQEDSAISGVARFGLVRN